MKFFNAIFAVLAASAVMCSCEKDHTYEDDSDPEIALYQITGTWKLESWSYGQIPEGVYSYIVLDSKENTFEIYQNVDSPYSRHLTGNFSLVYKEDKGQNIISGWYDHDSGFWASDYIVTTVTADSMTWISTGTTSGPQTVSTKTTQVPNRDICVYRRCDSIPEDILAGKN